MLIYQLVDKFKDWNINYVIVGGYALALHGIVRNTIDIDLVLNLRLKDFEIAEKALNEIGLESRIPVRAKDIISMREEFIQKRNLIAWSFVDVKNPTRQVDILITFDLRDIDTKKISVGHRKIHVASLEDLLKMKKAAGRPQDAIDVRSIQEKLLEQKK